MADAPANLLSLLAAAERDLATEQPEPSEFTADSEERDQLLLNQMMEDELERKSQSSLLSARHSQHRRTHRSSRQGRGDRSSRGGRGWSSAVSSSSCSGSALSSRQLQQLQQHLHQSSASGGSSAESPSSEELWKLMQTTNQQMVSMRQAEATAASRHRQEMARVQAKLDHERDKEIQAQKEKVNAEAKVSIVEAAQQVEIEIIERKLVTNHDIKDDAEEDAARRRSFLFQIEECARQQLESVRENISAKRQWQKEHDEAMRSVNADVKTAMVRDMASLSSQLDKVRKELKMVCDERDVLKRNVARRWGAKVNADNLQQMLDVASVELEKVQQVADGVSRPQQASPDVSLVYEMLMQSKNSEEEMEQEMSSLREQWYRVREQLDNRPSASEDEQGGQDAGDGSSRGGGGGSLACSVPTWRSEPRGLRAKAPVAPKASWTGRLMSIAEEEETDLVSQDGSVTGFEDAYEDVPPCSGDIVDLADDDIAQATAIASRAAVNAAVMMKQAILKENVENLQRSLVETKLKKEEIKEEMAKGEAELESHIIKMRAKLTMIKEEATQKEEAAIELEQIVVKEDKQISKVVEEVRVELDLVEKKKELKEEHIEQLFNEVTQREFQNAEDMALWHDLVRELQEFNHASKEAEAEAERHKLSMEKSRYHQEQVVMELQQQLAHFRRARFNAVNDHDDDDETTPQATLSHELPPGGELEQLQRDLRDTTEERNVLLNTLEWKDVQWRSVIEELELQLTSERVGLEARHAAEIKELMELQHEQLESLRRSLQSEPS